MPVWKLLFGFHGRIRRMQWWLSHAGVIVGSALIIMTIAVTWANISMPSGDPAGVSRVAQNFADLALFALGAAFLGISVALGVKRYHDLDRSGWWILLGFVPVANIWMLVELGFIGGAQVENRFGPSPKGMDTEDLRRIFS